MGDLFTMISLIDWHAIERIELEYYREGVNTVEEYESFREDRDFVTKFIRKGDFWATEDDYRRLSSIIAKRVLT